MAVSSLLIISACIVGTAICFCRRSPSPCDNSQVQCKYKKSHISPPKLFCSQQYWKWIEIWKFSIFSATFFSSIYSLEEHFTNQFHTWNLHTVNQTTIDSNGMTKYVQSTTARKSPHQINNTMTTLPLSGNLYRPAELSRYFRKIQNTLLMATVRPIWCLII